MTQAQTFYPAPIPMYPMNPGMGQPASAPYQQPQVNAVKIDIINPQAGIPTQPQPTYYFNQPMASIYGMPANSCYAPGGCSPQPYIAPTSVAAPVVETPVMPLPPAPVAEIPAPIATAPKAVEVPVTPTAPEALAKTETPVAPIAPVTTAPKETPKEETPVVPAAPETAKAEAPAAPTAPPAATIINPTIDVNAINTTLKGNDIDSQTVAIQKIAEALQKDPVNNTAAILNEQTFQGLVDIINKDTSALPGPKPGVAQDPNNLSQLEKAEINKQFAIYTLAMMQKEFRNEIDKEMTKNKLPLVSINDLPFIKEGIVNNLKDNPNPTIREACLSALNHIQKPEDKQVVKTLFEISAQHDANPSVKAAAQDFLQKVPA